MTTHNSYACIIIKYFFYWNHDLIFLRHVSIFSIFYLHINNRYFLCICQHRICIYQYPVVIMYIWISGIYDACINTQYLLWIYKYQVFLIHKSIPSTCYAYINIKYFWCMYQQRGRQMPRRAEAKRWQGACNDTIINMKYVFPRWKNVLQLLTLTITNAKCD